MKELLRNGNFTRLLLGRMITNAGDSLYSVAAMWLVYELGGSAFYTGLAGFLVMAPSILQFTVGPLVDRWSLRKTLVITQLLQGILVLVVPLAHYLGFLTIPLILTIMPVIALLNQFVYPAQTAALPTILKKEQLVKGNSAFSFAYQGIGLVFDALAGVLVAMIGASAIFIIDSVTFAIATVLFTSIKLPKKTGAGQSNESHCGSGKAWSSAFKQYGQELKEGFHFVWNSLLVKMFVGSVVANAAVGATLAVLPAFADWRGGAEFYGLYLGAISAGALVGSLAASFFSKYPLGKMSAVSFTLGGVLWIISALIPSVTVSILLFALAWIPVGITNVLAGAAIQTIVPERLLARTLSVAASFGTSAMPIGSLLGGFAGSVLGSVTVFTMTGFGFIFLSFYWGSVPSLRRLPKMEEVRPKDFGLSELA